MQLLNEKTHKTITMINKIKTQTSRNTNPAQNWGELRCAGRVSSSCSTSAICRVTVKRHEHRAIWKLWWTPGYLTEYE